MVTFHDELTYVASHVRLDGRPVGEIYSTPGGFCYIPRGQNKGGEYYPTLSLCKLSLEDI